MKLNKRSISVCLIILLINFILIQAKEHIFRSSLSKNKIKLKNKIGSKVISKVKVKRNADDDLREMKIFTFLIAFMTQMPYVDFIFITIEKAIDLISNFEQCGTLKSVYEQKVKEIYDETITQVEKSKKWLDAFEEKLEARSNIQTTGIFNEVTEISADEVQEIKNMGPRDRCKALKNFSKNDYKSWAKGYADMEIDIKFLERDLYDGIMSVDYFWNVDAPKNSTCSFFDDCKPRKYFKKLLVSLNIDSDLLKHIIENPFSSETKIYKEVISMTKKYSQILRSEYKNIKSVDCKSLPKQALDEKALKKEIPSFMGKAKAAFAVIPTILQCISISTTLLSIKSTVEEMINKLKGKVIAAGVAAKVLKYIVQFLADIFGLWFIRAAQIIFWIAKTIYYVYSAIKSMDEIDDISNEKQKNSKSMEISRNWGKAAGAGVRIILLILIHYRNLKKIMNDKNIYV